MKRAWIHFLPTQDVLTCDGWFVGTLQKLGVSKGMLSLIQLCNRYAVLSSSKDRHCPSPHRPAAILFSANRRHSALPRLSPIHPPLPNTHENPYFCVLCCVLSSCQMRVGISNGRHANERSSPAPALFLFFPTLSSFSSPIAPPSSPATHSH
jgi:hypothetical protein